MSTKPYKDIEKIMKEASEAYDQAFDTAAWEKMELLLDKDKDRERPFFWLWWLLPLLIVAGTGSYLFLQEKIQQHKQTVVVENINQPGLSNKNEPVTDHVVPVSGIIPQSKHDSTGLKDVNRSTAVRADISNQNKAWKNSKSNQEDNVANQEAPGSKKNSLSYTANGKAGVTIQAGQAADDVENAAFLHNSNSNSDTIAKRELMTDEPVKEETMPIVKESMLNDTTMKLVKNTDTVVASKLVKSKSPGKQSKFYFIAAAGMDANGMKLLSFQKMTIRGGIGVGYRFTKNISVQSGFYAGSKKYAAGKNDYKFKAGSYWTRVDITKIDADCRVYEIPLLIRYDFNVQKSISYFTSLGLSSFFMDKEEYEYYYYRNGVAYEAFARYIGNQHLFSVLGISAGAEKKISSRFSFNASVGLSIPLAGVGEGKVKLFGTNFMAGLKYTPIKKIKKIK